MNRAGILNLFDKLETRAQRMERAFAPNASTGSTELLHRLRDLRNLARRFRSKVDVLRPADLAEIRDIIYVMQNMASYVDLNFRLIHVEYENRVASDALKDDAVFLGNLVNGIQLGLNLSPEEVLDVLPAQKPAAFRFGYDGSREEFVVVDEPFRPAHKQEQMATAALEEITEQGEELNNDLRLTNAAPRLKNAFLRLQTKLASHSNIVQVGLCNGSASRILTAYVDELSLSQFEQLRAHVEGVALVLSQYPEWRDFCQNAAETVLDDAAVTELRAQTAAIRERLRESSKVSPDVSQALTDVVDWVGDGAHPDRRDVLALVRTQENFWSVLSKNALSKAVIDESAKLAARTLIRLVLATIGVGFDALIAKAPGAEWLEPTIAFLRANLNSLLK